MSRLRIGLLIVLLAVGALVAIALSVAPEWTPERLRVEAETRLSEALDAEVRVGEVELALGVGIHLEAKDVRFWAAETGGALMVDTIAIGMEPLSLLLGELRPRRMVLEGAALKIVEDAEGRWSPPFEFLDPDPAEPARSLDEEILLVLSGLEETLRVLLEKPFVADSLSARRSVVTLSLGKSGGSDDASEPLEIRFELEEGRLRHSRLSGDAVLEIDGVLAGPGGVLGRVQWKTERDRHEVVTTELTFDALHLGAAEPWIRRLLPRARIAGRVDGTMRVDWPRPSVSRVKLDLSLADFGAHAPEGGRDLGELSAPEAEVEVAIAVNDDGVEIERLRVTAGALELGLEGEVGRPLGPRSRAALDFSAREIEVAGAKALLEWLPAERREAIADPILTRVLAGRIHAFDLAGAGAIRSWGDFFVGTQAPAAMDLSGGVHAAGVVLHLGEEDRLERLAVEARWSGDRLDVVEATADLGGSPLPALHLKIDGVSNWFISDPSLRRISSGALPLSGIPLLWERLSFDRDDEDEERFQAAVALDIETLQYPLFIWPLEDVHAVVESGQRGLDVLLTRGTWGGVPVQGSASWIFEPEREVFVQLDAGVPRSLAPLPPPRYAWARGRFVVHPIESREWHRLSASGAFSADAGILRVHDVAVDLAPAGTMRASGHLDLSFEDHIPFQLSGELIGGELGALLEELDVLAGQATGSFSAWGTFDGALREDGSTLADLSGSLEVDARDGEIWRKLPPVLSIALASEAFNPFAERETIRYGSVKTHLDIDDGRMTTESFSLDGPDLRVFADGELDLAKPPHAIDADVALFLFRQLDQAIDLIPVLNVLLLGSSENLVAAHFELSGPWDDPEAELLPLRSLAGGPASLVLESIPNIVRKGFDAIGDIFDDDDDRSSEPKPFPWES